MNEFTVNKCCTVALTVEQTDNSEGSEEGESTVAIAQEAAWKRYLWHSSIFTWKRLGTGVGFLDTSEADSRRSVKTRPVCLSSVTSLKPL